MRKKLTLLLAVLGLLFLLSGCKVSGNPLPEGMEEETVLEQGREIVSLLNEGSWQEIYDRLRPDAQETSSPAGIQSYMEERLDKAGAYTQEKEAMATGQTAVFYCIHEKKKIMYRVAFSIEMELMGIEAKVQ